MVAQSYQHLFYGRLAAQRITADAVAEALHQLEITQINLLSDKQQHQLRRRLAKISRRLGRAQRLRR